MIEPVAPLPMLAAIAYARAIEAGDHGLAADVRSHLGDDTALLEELAEQLVNRVVLRDPTTGDRTQAMDRLLYYAAGLIPPPAAEVT